MNECIGERTIARVNNPANEELFLALGISVTVSPTAHILHLVQEQIPHYSLVPLLKLSRIGLGLVEITIPPDSPAVGRDIRTLDLPRSVNIAAIARGDENITPRGDTVFKSDDHLFALTTEDGERILRERILRDIPAPQVRA